MPDQWSSRVPLNFQMISQRIGFQLKMFHRQFPLNRIEQLLNASRVRLSSKKRLFIKRINFSYKICITNKELIKMINTFICKHGSTCSLQVVVQALLQDSCKSSKLAVYNQLIPAANSITKMSNSHPKFARRQWVAKLDRIPSANCG